MCLTMMMETYVSFAGEYMTAVLDELTVQNDVRSVRTYVQVRLSLKELYFKNLAHKYTKSIHILTACLQTCHACVMI